MASNVINLRRVRKRRERVATADKAAENRVRFGRDKAEKALARHEGAQADKAHRGRHIEPDDSQ